MSAANAGVANAIMAAVPSKTLLMTTSLLVSLRPQSNNVASIWLLRGNAGAVILRNCDGAATTPICCRRCRTLAGKRRVFGLWICERFQRLGSRLAENGLGIPR